MAVALLYSTLPHFSTDRFWVAAFQANVSMTLYFLSQYAALRAVRARGGRWLPWGALATAAAVASVLAYEVALPLFVLTPFLVAYRSRQLPRTDSTRRRSRLLLAAALVALGAALAAKLVVAVRVGHESSYQLGASGGIVHHLGYLVRGGVAVNGGTYGLALPYVTGWVVLHRLGWIVAVLALVTAGGVFLYLRRLARSEWELPTATFATRIILAGIAVVALGYAVFITNSEIFFTSAGVDNRVNIAAGFGMAIVLVGLVGWAAAHLPPRARSSGFAGALAALCAAGFVIVNGLASFWITAAQRQDAVLDGIQAHLPAGNGEATVLLDGICPEVGPGVVFTTQYDLTGALYLRYHDSRLEGAALSPQVQARPKALWIANYFNGREDLAPLVSVRFEHVCLRLPARHAAPSRRRGRGQTLLSRPQFAPGLPADSELRLGDSRQVPACAALALPPNRPNAAPAQPAGGTSRPRSACGARRPAAGPRAPSERRETPAGGHEGSSRSPARPTS